MNCVGYALPDDNIVLRQVLWNFWCRSSSSDSGMDQLFVVYSTVARSTASELSCFWHLESAEILLLLILDDMPRAVQKWHLELHISYSAVFEFLIFWKYWKHGLIALDAHWNKWTKMSWRCSSHKCLSMQNLLKTLNESSLKGNYFGNLMEAKYRWSGMYKYLSTIVGFESANHTNKNFAI